jgi:predicted ATP-binding protein involved in virulence
MVPDWVDMKFHWGLDDLVGKLENGEWMPFSNLSDGYRGIVSLTADIAYRAIKLNPHLKERAVIDTQGIVLIDEIDMHLHPKWQKHVVLDLKRTFPNIQFIVTSHSPFILQSMAQEEVIHLDGETISKDPNLMSIEEIAEDMDVENVRRSELFIQYQNAAAEYFKALKEGKNSTNDEHTQILKMKLDSLEVEFSDNPVYVALMKGERQALSR